MAVIQFSHANGFPAKSYSYLFELLSPHQVFFVEKMGHGNFPLNKDLNNFADELIEDIEKKQNLPVIGVGHSTGGVVTLLAAVKRRDVFSKIILIDPVLFSSQKRFGIWLLQKLGLGDFLGSTRKAMKRRTHFSTLEEATQYFQSKPLFRNFHPRSFQGYIDHGIISSQNGLELSFSAKVEADIFRYTQIFIPHESFNLSGTLIYGDKSSIFWPSDVKWWKKKFLRFQLISFPGGHLFPFEEPEATAKLINKLIQSDKLVS
ncbi:MAG: alpha/beta fold hydrolase [Candidatus Scalinduaceae bacterium]